LSSSKAAAVIKFITNEHEKYNLQKIIEIMRIQNFFS